MKPGRSSLLLAIVAVVAAVAVASGLQVFAQAQTPSGGSLAEVAAELRLLRAALEDNGNKQTMAAMLTAQGARAQPFIFQLADIRQRLDKANEDVRDANASVLRLQAQLGTGPANRTSAIESLLKASQATWQAAVARETDLRNRELEITQALQREEATWNDLMNRLQQAIKR